MPHYAYRIRPRRAWRTPWLADTLMGRLALEAVHLYGRGWMLAQLQLPAMQRQPAFVLSDACPGELLPMPHTLRMAPMRENLFRTARRCQWVTRSTFDLWRSGKHAVESTHLEAESGVRDADVWHNSLSRLDMTTQDMDGGLYAKTETQFDPHLTPDTYFTVYAWARDAAALALLTELLQSLSGVGFGADTSTGAGAFSLEGEPQEAAWLAAPAGSTGLVSLSTFQPATTDPVDGAWQHFVKHGKFSPDVLRSEVPSQAWRKAPQVMLKAGTVLYTPEAKPWLGGLIRVGEHAEDEHGLMQFAHGLAVAGQWNPQRQDER